SPVPIARVGRRWNIIVAFLMAPLAPEANGAGVGGEGLVSLHQAAHLDLGIAARPGRSLDRSARRWTDSCFSGPARRGGRLPSSSPVTGGPARRADARDAWGLARPLQTRTGSLPCPATAPPARPPP